MWSCSTRTTRSWKPLTSWTSWNLPMWSLRKTVLSILSMKKYFRSRVIIGTFARIKELADQCRCCQLAWVHYPFICQLDCFLMYTWQFIQCKCEVRDPDLLFGWGGSYDLEIDEPEGHRSETVNMSYWRRFRDCLMWWVLIGKHNLDNTIMCQKASFYSVFFVHCYRRYFSVQLNKLVDLTIIKLHTSLWSLVFCHYNLWHSSTHLAIFALSAYFPNHVMHHYN